MSGEADTVADMAGEDQRPPRRRSTRCRVYVGNIAYTTTAAELRQMFLFAGPVLDVYLPARGEGEDGHRGYGFVEMATQADAARAIELVHGTQDPAGRRLIVREAV